MKGTYVQKDDFDVLTLVVASCTLLITFWQGYLTRKHNRLSVRPWLAWNRSYQTLPEGTRITFSLENNGVGPAIVRERYFTKGEVRFSPEAEHAIDGETENFVKSVIPEGVAFHLEQHGLPGPRHALLPGVSMPVAKIFFPERDARDVEKLMRRLQLGFTVRYESIYGQKLLMQV